MQTLDFYSFEQQDEFISNLFKFKQNGTFLDVACGHPIIGNNTYALEKNFNWNGWCFDIGYVDQFQYLTYWDQTLHVKKWSEVRKAELVRMDATSQIFTEYLANNVSDTIIDYVSLDVDCNGVNYALEVLQRILDAGVQFRAITLEHEIYRTDTIQDASTSILTELGYVRLFKNIRLWGGGVVNDTDIFSEDWWVHPEHFDKELLAVADSNLYFFDCVEKMKTWNTTPYKGHHHCSQAFAKEVDIYGEGVYSYQGHPVRNPEWKSAWE